MYMKLSVWFTPGELGTLSAGFSAKIIDENGKRT